MTEFTPCAPVYVVSSHRNKPVIQYRSKRWEGKLLEFRFKSHASKNVIYYQCIACKSVADLARISNREKSPVAHLKLENGVIVTDPDFPSTLHNCNVDHDDNKASKVLTKRFGYENRMEIRESRKRPRQLFDESMDIVEKRFKAEFGDTIVNEVKVNMSGKYGFHSQGRALSRNRAHNIIKDNPLEELSCALQVTRDGEKFLQR